MTENKTLWTKTYTLLFITNFLTWSGFSLLLSTMPLYVLHIGAPQSLVGLVVGVYPLAALVSRPFAGYAYDTFSRQHVFLVFLALFAFTTFGYIPAVTVLLLITIRILQGMFFGVATTGAGTIVADIVHPQRVGEGVGYFGLGNTLSRAVGPAFGIWVMDAYGFEQVFMVSGIIMGISFVLALFVSYPKYQQRKRNKLSLQNIIEKRVLSVASLTIVLGSVMGCVMTYVIVFSKEIGLVNGGIYFTLNALGVALSRLFAGRIMDKHGPRPILIFGFITFALGALILSFSTEMILYGIASVILGIGSGTIMPTIQAMVINMVSSDRRGAATATHFTAVDAGIGGGSIVLGWIAGFTSLSTMFLICAFLLMIPLLLFNFYVLKDYQKKSAEIEELRLEAAPVIS